MGSNGGTTGATVDSLKENLGTRTDWLFVGWIGFIALMYFGNHLFIRSVEGSYIVTFLIYGALAVLGYYDKTLRKLLIIGTVAGFVELLGDHFLVHVADTLVYPYLLPPLMSSPIYMPFAWTVTTSISCYLGLRAKQLIGLLPAVVIPGLFGLLVVGSSEIGAANTGAWHYTSAPFMMITGKAPLFILLAEGIMFSTAVFFVERDNPFLAGIGYGTVINLSYIGVYYLMVLFSML